MTFLGIWAEKVKVSLSKHCGMILCPNASAPGCTVSSWDVHSQSYSYSLDAQVIPVKVPEECFLFPINGTDFVEFWKKKSRATQRPKLYKKMKQRGSMTWPRSYNKLQQHHWSFWVNIKSTLFSKDTTSPTQYAGHNVPLWTICTWKVRLSSEILTVLLGPNTVSVIWKRLYFRNNYKTESFIMLLSRKD